MSFNSFAWKNLRFDVLSGFTVFLIALPLCIGISVASNTPPTAGIVTAIIGGILGSFLSGSYLTINGPAAGLIVIVAACVEEMGNGNLLTGYKKMLACSILAGGIQIFLGLARVGRFAIAFPGAVVHSMLSAIGVIIIAKQIYPLMGIKAVAGGPLQSFAQFPMEVLKSNEAIAFIGLVCLVAVFSLARMMKKYPALRRIPIPLVIALIGVGLGILFDLEHHHSVDWHFIHFVADSKFLLAVPEKLAAALYAPDFSSLWSGLSLKHALLLAFVASIESLLSVCAVDRLDPQKRRSDLDKDLLGKGVCNALSGFLGGLPMIAEIVRSSANISNGARTQASNFFHGFFLLVFLATIPGYLHLVPLCSLAAILIFVGYQLAKPSHFFEVLHKGKDQGFVFLVTLLGILATDLLLGVLLGTLTEFFVLVYRAKTFNLFRLQIALQELEDRIVIKLEGPFVFTNHLQLKKTLEQMNNKQKVFLDLTTVRTVDVTAKENLQHWSNEITAQGRNLEILYHES